MRVGITEALGLLFIGLKLGGIIDWSWWLVTAPFWAVYLMALLVGAIIGWWSRKQ